MAAEVDQWFVDTSHPLAELMQLVRATLLGTDSRIKESIKWKSPTFSSKGNIASINPQAKQFVSLMFHRGAEIPGDFPSLEGGGEVALHAVPTTGPTSKRRQASSRSACKPGAR